MTPEAAVQTFLGSFDIPAYASASAPDENDERHEYPYLTYDLSTGMFGESDVSVAVNLWFRTDSEKVPNAKVREIGERLGIGGITVPCDSGLVWIKRGEPFCQSVPSEGDNSIKRRYILLDVEFLTS